MSFSTLKNDSSGLIEEQSNMSSSKKTKPWLAGTIVQIDRGEYVSNSNDNLSSFSSSLCLPVLRYVIFPSFFPSRNHSNDNNNNRNNHNNNRSSTKSNRYKNMKTKDKIELIIASNEDEFNQCSFYLDDINHKLVTNSSYEYTPYHVSASIPSVPYLGSRVWYTESNSFSLHGKRGCIEAIMTANEDQLFYNIFDGNIRQGVIVGIDYKYHVVKVCDHPDFLSFWNENESFFEDLKSNNSSFIIDVTENKIEVNFSATNYLEEGHIHLGRTFLPNFQRFAKDVKIGQAILYRVKVDLWKNEGSIKNEKEDNNQVELNVDDRNLIESYGKQKFDKGSNMKIKFSKEGPMKRLMNLLTFHSDYTFSEIDILHLLPVSTSLMKKGKGKNDSFKSLNQRKFDLDNLNMPLFPREDFCIYHREQQKLAKQEFQRNGMSYYLSSINLCSLCKTNPGSFYLFGDDNNDDDDNENEKDDLLIKNNGNKEISFDQNVEDKSDFILNQREKKKVIHFQCCVVCLRYLRRTSLACPGCCTTGLIPFQYVPTAILEGGSWWERKLTKQQWNKYAHWCGYRGEEKNYFRNRNNDDSNPTEVNQGQNDLFNSDTKNKIQCVNECGFYGCAETNYLCSACYDKEKKYLLSIKSHNSHNGVYSSNLQISERNNRSANKKLSEREQIRLEQEEAYFRALEEDTKRQQKVTEKKQEMIKKQNAVEEEKKKKKLWLLHWKQKKKERILIPSLDYSETIRKIKGEANRRRNSGKKIQSFTEKEEDHPHYQQQNRRNSKDDDKDRQPHQQYISRGYDYTDGTEQRNIVIINKDKDKTKTKLLRNKEAEDFLKKEAEDLSKVWEITIHRKLDEINENTINDLSTTLSSPSKSIKSSANGTIVLSAFFYEWNSIQDIKDWCELQFWDSPYPLFPKKYHFINFTAFPRKRVCLTNEEVKEQIKESMLVNLLQMEQRNKYDDNDQNDIEDMFIIIEDIGDPVGKSSSIGKKMVFFIEEESDEENS